MLKRVYKEGYSAQLLQALSAYLLRCDYICSEPVFWNLRSVYHALLTLQSPDYKHTAQIVTELQKVMHANAEHNFERGRMVLALSGHPAWLDPKLWTVVEDQESLIS